jgi:hypothetical protein
MNEHLELPGRSVSECDCGDDRPSYRAARPSMRSACMGISILLDFWRYFINRNKFELWSYRDSRLPVQTLCGMRAMVLCSGVSLLRRNRPCDDAAALSRETRWNSRSSKPRVKLGHRAEHLETLELPLLGRLHFSAINKYSSFRLRTDSIHHSRHIERQSQPDFARRTTWAAF